MLFTSKRMRCSAAEPQLLHISSLLAPVETFLTDLKLSGVGLSESEVTACFNMQQMASVTFTAVPQNNKKVQLINCIKLWTTMKKDSRDWFIIHVCCFCGLNNATTLVRACQRLIPVLPPYDACVQVVLSRTAHYIGHFILFSAVKEF